MIWQACELAVVTGQPIGDLLDADPQVIRAMQVVWGDHCKRQNKQQRQR